MTPAEATRKINEIIDICNSHKDFSVYSILLEWLAKDRIDQLSEIARQAPAPATQKPVFDEKALAEQMAQLRRDFEGGGV